MASRQAARTPITDDDDVNLDDIDTLPPDDDNEPGEGDEPDAGDEPGEGDEPDAGDEPGEGDEPDAGDEPGEGDEPDAARRRQAARPEPTRGERRQQRLANENRDLRTNMDALQRRFDEFVRGQDTARREQQRETPEQRSQRRALMAPEERAAEDIREAQERMGGLLNNAQLTIADTTDKSAYDLRARSDKIFQRYQPKVEAELASLRQRGQNAPREAILKWLIGDAVLKKRESGDTRGERQRARQRVRAANTRPSDSRDDATVSRRRKGNDLESRLADTPI